ncbi:MAG: serine/threonine protein kinase [Lentisphaeria bacterium]|nr:serine/threonine protein kinase [Lentisphaeria bacterium]
MKETELSEKHHSYGLPDKYVNSCILGVGGMKEVLICTDRESLRRVAVAIPRVNDPEENRKFLEEARLTARLEHPNIVPVHEVGTTSEGKPYFVMKLASGLTLAKIIKKLREQDPEFLKRYTLNVLLDIFQKICKAVEFAHSKNICHLDLKPENIQVGEYGEVLILDWGLAHEFDSNHPTVSPAKTQKVQRIDFTQDGLIKGTPEYMSPEQALGINTSRTPQCDIYSLGAILYTMLTFHAPIGGKTRDEIIQNAADGNILPIRRQANGGRKIPLVLQFIVFKAMNRAPSKRYRSVSEMERDIISYQRGFPTKAEKAGIFTRILLFLKRERMQMFLAVALFFICFMFVVFLLAKMHFKNEELRVYEGSVMENPL